MHILQINETEFSIEQLTAGIIKLAINQLKKKSAVSLNGNPLRVVSKDVLLYNDGPNICMVNTEGKRVTLEAEGG